MRNRRSLLLLLALALLAVLVPALWRRFGPPAKRAASIGIGPDPWPPVPDRLERFGDSRPQDSTSGDRAGQDSAPAQDTIEQDGSAWVAPEGGACPTTHPIKAKLSSGLYHLPGMSAYQRTHPDRCYAKETDAMGDGLRKAKR